MAKIYFNLITAGEMTLDEVPLLWRERVEELLNKSTTTPNR